MLSQNGWPANRDPEAIGVVPFTVSGVSFPNGVRGGDVETVLCYLAEQFHTTVEPLQGGKCWGYFYKPIEGSTTLSNHASATAIDINAPAHPMGVRGTFNSSKCAAIRRILTFLEDVVRWGGDYVGRADEMHFEIDGNATDVARIAKKIRTLKVDDMSAEDVVNYLLKDPTDGSTHRLGDYVRFIEYNVKQQINEIVVPKLDEINRKLDALNK